MKNEIENKVIAWIESAAPNIERFIADEIPPFIKEYLHWQFIECFYFPIFLLLITLIFVMISFKANRAYNNKKQFFEMDAEFISYISAIFGMVSSLMFFIALAANVPQMIKIKCAPRVYLVEKIEKVLTPSNQ